MDSVQLSTLSKLILGSHFEGVFAKNNLPPGRHPNRMFILNTDTANLPGRHWIAVFIRDNIGYVFDPLGMVPPPLRLINWMNERYLQWSYNKRQVQPIDSNMCGVYCMYFLYHASIISTSTNLNDLFDNHIFPKTKTLESNELSINKFLGDITDKYMKL